jgi:glycogen operon protein
MIAFRRAHPVLSREQFYEDAEIQWLGPEGGLPNWFDHKEKAFACVIEETAQDTLLIFNAGTNGIAFRLPPLPEPTSWRLAVDTSGLKDLFAEGEEPIMDSSRPYNIEARSSAILLARKKVK